MGVIHGLAIWPGALQVVSCTYTASHGITPGVAILRMLPQPVFPALFGTLLITDGNETVPLPDCKLDALKLEYGSDGIIWSLEITDRRWKWKDLGQISGCYNQLDPRGKLIPWMIRSPLELTILCLRALDERKYRIDVPAGVDSASGSNIKNFLSGGQNFPPTGVNPPVDWQAEPPAQALEKLASQFGRRVVLSLADNSVSIVKPGVGAFLPTNRSISKLGPSIKDPESPDGVGVVGAETRWQARFAMVAVGEEWDGSYKPINALSYAPTKNGKVQITTCKIEETPEAFAAGQKFQLWLYGDNQPAFPDGAFIEIAPGGADTNDTMATAFAAAVNASVNTKIKPFIKASSAANIVTLTGKTQGVPFDVEGRMSPLAAPGKWTILLVQAAQKGGTSWQYCLPPLFPTVRATDRLTYTQAVALAQKSVFRCYQLSDLDVSGTGPINIPGYHLLVRKQQVLLQDTQVDQVVPEPLDKTLTDRQGKPLVINFYNGYSRDKPAACYGSVSQFLQNAYWPKGGPANGNTADGTQIFVDFAVDSVFQLITFNSYVYKGLAGGGVEEAKVILQTACKLRNPITNHIERYTLVSYLPRQSGTNFYFQKFEDVQLNVTATYKANNTIDKVDILEIDPILRANYYLTGMALQYLIQEAQVIEYNGIVFIPLDGAISQVTWEVGESGCRTEAGRNTEPNVWVAPYPARRRQEMLRPAQQNKIDGDGKAPGGPGKAGA